MVFNSLQFLPFIFIVLLFHRFADWRYDRYFLLGASYFFYASFNPPFVLILAASTCVDYWVGKAIYRTDDRLRRRLLLAISCLVNLGFLGYFKYAGFLTENLNLAFGQFGVQFADPNFDIILPVGISFYTFQSLSYTFDIYRGKLKPYGFVEFALFVCFFTQLVAGPIVRASHLLPQLTRKKIPSFRTVSMGTFLVVLGYAKKIVFADNIAPFVNNTFEAAARSPIIDQFMALLGFAMQIYCDFSGYSDIAIGLSLIMGLRLRRNFRRPYLARGFSDFWRRWHISLSTWIRDYVFIPLGGSRGSPPRVAMNVMLTMGLCGLWHGASWMFVLWGLLHGAYLVAERIYNWFFEQVLCKRYPIFAGIRNNVIYAALSTGTTFLLVCFGWALFRASSLADAWLFILSFPKIMYGLAMSGVDSLHWRNEFVYIVLFLLIHVILFFIRHYKIRYQPHWFFYSLALSFMLFFISVGWESNNVFIYFQF